MVATTEGGVLPTNPIGDDEHVRSAGVEVHLRFVAFCKASIAIVCTNGDDAIQRFYSEQDPLLSAVAVAVAIVKFSPANWAWIGDFVIASMRCSSVLISV